MIVDTVVTLIKVNKLSHDNVMMISCKVTVWRYDEERLMKPDAWPRFISCCSYVRPRRRRQKHHEWYDWYRDDTEHVFGVVH